MIWADRIAKQLKGKPLHIDDMKTASGFIHVGSLRGPLLHDVMYKVLKSQGEKVIFTYVFNDFDPIDGLSEELKEDFNKYLGYPLRHAPSPDGKARSFADYFADDFKKVLQGLGCEAKYLSSYDMYNEGKFNGVIKEALNSRDKILEVYRKIAGYKKKTSDWYPLQVICPKCSKLGTTKVTGWDGKLVEFTCEENLVEWARGCGYQGKISPYDGNGKLPWKVDWPAHWKVLGVTFEGAGKDHASRGGSYDIAFALCEEVFHYPKPFYFPYEFFLFGGKKMSSSKGIGLKANEITTVLPPEVARFLIIRTLPKRTLEFDPKGMIIPDLFDEFDRCARAYWDLTDPDLSRIFELSKVNDLYKQKVFLPRFIDLARMLNNAEPNLIEQFSRIKSKQLSQEELEIIKLREKYARIWLEKYAPDEYHVQLTAQTPHLVKDISSSQKNYLQEVIGLLQIATDPEKLQKDLYERSKAIGISPKDAFSAIYMSTIGKRFGPKAGAFLLQFPKVKVIQRFREAISHQLIAAKQVKKFAFPLLKRNDLFTIDAEVRNKFPSIIVGVAIIKNVKIKKSDSKLEKEIHQVLKPLSLLTSKSIGEYPEVQSYRRLYKEIGVDWHSRRPSPEALLRRIALKKGLYSVNTCVDAYNLVVLKSRISVGAFDLDKIKFSTILRFAKDGENIHLHGDNEPTPYKPGELAYFDALGGINLDFNYRDAKRTLVTEKTKNLWINIEGIYEITREQVEKSLQETIDIITKYCSGSVEIAGIFQT